MELKHVKGKSEACGSYAFGNEKEFHARGRYDG